jgi:peptide/nickel transport system permease protein
MSTPAGLLDGAVEELPADLAIRHRGRTMRRVLASWSGRVGFVGTALVLLIACLGPLVGGSPTSQSGIPFSPPDSQQVLGTDILGRSVLDRVLHGGLRLILVAAVATLLAYLIGASLGLLAGYRRGRMDDVTMRVLDVLLSFPPILLLLVLAAGIGQGLITIFIGTVLVNVPGAARVIRSATQEIVGRPYVEAAVLRGEPTRVVLAREILPNIRGSVLADAGPRLSGTIILIAGLNYLSIGVNPPTPDWGAMIFENRQGLTLNPWAVAVPALLIVLLVVSVNLLADVYARSTGRSGVLEGAAK